MRDEVILLQNMGDFKHLNHIALQAHSRLYFRV